MAETIFSKIIRKEIPAHIVYESETILAFKDISPKAPQHILVIPKTEIRSLVEAKQEHKELLGEMLLVCSEIARSLGLDQKGFRVVVNSGAEAGQTVFHLHMHILGGRPMNWPPG
ncbi:MAG: histidine triad nucleotide-binding protein [Proteobacteria bacterium]|nr:MAG: histidine triad nucleotide-binding protein [Pseudomonadota bacterium]